jgi:DNA topoisomerase-1
VAKNLVIVESPTKVKTIKKFLGAGYDVEASNGHIRDLPKSRLGIDVENDFEPKYITIRGKGELLSSLKKAAKKSDKIYLATDPDREGEAISWHLQQAMPSEAAKMHRITFNEITKSAVKASLKAPRDIDMDLVNEQQARRCLDRMVGYEISPLLWKKVKRGLSAGRVQSVALRIIADREAEIESFIPEEYWTIAAMLKVPEGKKTIRFQYYGKGGRKADVKSEDEAKKILGDIKNGEFVIDEVKKSEKIKKAPLPFTTSTLQQDASRLLNFSTQKTMRVAQQLYEGVEIKGRGSVGLISYLRTDSTRISEEADAAVRNFIRSNYGKEFEGAPSAAANAKQRIQDAHEAIRPTEVTLTPAFVKDSLGRDQFRLYQLIWNRFTASRMKPAVYESLSVKALNSDYTFTASTSSLKFEGFMMIYKGDDDAPEKNAELLKLKEGVRVTADEIIPEQHFTQPPAHYTEASLVKTLEELGIGRPSTYAPTITTIMQRRYIVKEKKNIFITELGDVVNNMMKQAFPSIVDVNFTANMEALLDSVGEGKVKWKTVLENFWPDLVEAVKAAEKDLENVTIEDEVTDVVCENCGRNMVIKFGPHGKFLACPGFPECHNTKPYLEKAGVKCPKCGGEVLIKKTRKGRRYYGCENNPDCDFMTWQKPTGKLCPKCQSPMIKKGGQAVCSDYKCGYKAKN